MQRGCFSEAFLSVLYRLRHVLEPVFPRVSLWGQSLTLALALAAPADRCRRTKRATGE